MSNLISIDSLEYFVDGVICVDPSGKISRINQAACELLGVSATRIVEKKQVEDLLLVNSAKFDSKVIAASQTDCHIQIAKLSAPGRKEFQARIVAIPPSITKSESAIIVIKDLSHEDELFQKYQGQMRMKDQKIYESQLLNSILQKIRLTKDPHAMIRQIGHTIMKEIRSEVGLLLTTKADSVSCDIITDKQNRSKFLELLSARNCSPDGFNIQTGVIACFPKEQLPEPLKSSWPLGYYCQIGLYEGHEAISLLLAVETELSSDELTLIKTIRDQTSISISSSHFEKLSHIDELTNIYNRRYFIQQAQLVFRTICTEGKDCSIVILDLDHFKKINDTDGHLFGDEVLKIVGSLLQRNARISDVIARYGGEEFIIFLPETNSHEASFQAERVRKALEANEITKGTSTRRVTGSFGIACRQQSGANSIEELIEYADQALYHSKENGRNRFTIYQPLDFSKK